VLGRYNDAAAPVAIDLYESQNEIGTVGAGISVWPRTRTLLERLGMLGMLKGELGAEMQNEGEGKGI
jgi:salicylate hydroxylase